jgi:hypothetical protein
MALPSPVDHDWADLSVGGSSNDPTILHLVEENLMTNGDFEEVLSGWANSSGTAPSRVDLGSDAARGNYVMNLKASSITHKAIAFTGTKVLLTGMVKFVATDASGSFDVTLYITGSSSYVATPASKFVKLTINSQDAYVVGTTYFMPFFIELEVTAGAYAHINFAADASVEVYIDDLRMYEVSKNVALNNPTSLSVRYQRLADSEYEMFDLSKKIYLRGWRPVYSIGYDFIDAAGLVKNIGLTESMFNFFIPHSNNLGGAYVRATGDFSGEPFQGRYLGHTNSLELEGIFIVKNKSREYGDTYFSVASAT